MTTTITIAIVRSANGIERSDADDFTSATYDLLLMDRHDGVQLPTCSITPYSADAARRKALQTSRQLIGAYRTPLTRAVLLPKSNIVCVPVQMMPAADSNDTQHVTAQFMNIAKLDQLLNTFGTDRIDVQSVYALATLIEWMCSGERRHGRRAWTSSLFARPPITNRMTICVHNPSLLKQMRACSRYTPAAKQPHASVDLDVDVETANALDVRLRSLDKCIKLVMNPLSNMTLSATTVRYYCRDRIVNDDLSIAQLSSTTNSTHTSDESSSAVGYSDAYRLHYFANSGDVQGLQEQLLAGFNPNQADRYSWTPLHYAAWYNHLDCVMALVNYGEGCDVNARTKNQSTPLHFAARTGNVYVVELLLSHANIDVRAKDAEQKTPLDVCASVPKDAWQQCAALLRAANQIDAHPKIQIDMMDGSNCMISLVNGEETTAAELHTQMCNSLSLPGECRRLFKLWLCSEHLQLQLKDEHKPRVHIEKWTRQLHKFADVASTSKDETPRLVFRRDARITVDDERQLVKVSSAAHNLLYHEAVHNYLAGLYPCSRDDVALLGALILQILHGKYVSSRTSMDILCNERTRAKIIPMSRTVLNDEKILKNIVKEHKKMRERSSAVLQGLQSNFLTFCWKLVVYGATFFNADMYIMTNPTSLSAITNGSSTQRSTEVLEVLAGVNDIGLHLINARTNLLMKTYEIDTLTFVYEQDKPYVQLTANGDDRSVQHFRLRTMKAVHIVALLKQAKTARH